MPVINFSYSDLSGLVGREVSREALRERLPMIGADMRPSDEDSDEMSFEFFPDRPDLYSVEGIARALRAFLGHEPGLRSYAVEPSDVELVADASVKRVRPYIWCALVEGNDIDDFLIRSMMDLQEKLHITLGRNRKKVAIGIHDYRAVKPPFMYKAVRPDALSFVPLQSDREMTLAEILTDHEKGRAYASVLEGKQEYPIIVDREGTVLSFPPIINGIATAVKESTRDIFVDCTGTDLNAVKNAVNILTAALAERGSKIRSVSIKTVEGEMRAPDLTARVIHIDPGYVNDWIGTSLDPEEMAKCLMAMGHGASIMEGEIEVHVPAYRADIIHPVDLAEDVAIGHGFEKFGHRLPTKSTFGFEDPVNSFSQKLRPILVGLGYQEVVTLSLSNAEEQYIKMNLDRRDDIVKIMNPVSEEHTQIRTSLLPSLLAILRKNKHRELPQKVFEIGESATEKGNRTLISGTTIHWKAGFTEVKSDVQALASSLGLQMDVMRADHPSFISGRCATVAMGGREVGVLGEIAPSALISYELGYPVIAYELDLETLLDLVSGR